METKAEFKSLFAELGDSMDLDEIENLLPFAEKYVCKLYPSVKRYSNVNKARHHMFSKNVKSGKVVDLSGIPPCSSVLKNHLLRDAFISNMWKNSSVAVNYQYQMSEYGWNDDGSMFWTDRKTLKKSWKMKSTNNYSKMGILPLMSLSVMMKWASNLASDTLPSCCLILVFTHLYEEALSLTNIYTIKSIINGGWG